MLIDDYIDYCNKYKEIYQVYAVLMQVGSFFELYGTEKEGVDVDKICDLLEIQSTRKNKSITEISRKNPKMAGIPLFVLDKYLDILIDNGYTVILVEQVTTPPEPKREVTKIISPATREINSIDNNYLMCVYFSVGKENQNKFILGSISFIDVNTNDSYIFETMENDTQLNLEDILRVISTNKPGEILIFTDIELKKNENLLQILKEYIRKIPVVCIHDKLDFSIPEQFFKLSYQKYILHKVFKNTGMLSSIEYIGLENRPISIICYTYLLQFIYEHNEKILEGMTKPVFLENNKYLLLVNNVLENLNITSNNTSKTASILNLLNNCNTSIGKRYFKQAITNPLTNSVCIQKRYDMCDYFIKGDFYKTCRILLSQVSDIERLFKRISTKTIQPPQFLFIHKSVKAVQLLTKELINNNSNFKLLNQDKLDEFILYLEKQFNLDEMEKVNINQVSKNIFNKEIYNDLDKMQKDILILENIFENVCLALNEGNENNTEFKLEISKSKDKQSRYISVTKNRYENMIKDAKRSENIDKILKEKCNLTLKDISSKSFSSSNTANLKIMFKNMDSNQLKLIELQNEFKEIIKYYYFEQLMYIQLEFKNIFTEVSEFVAKVDFYCCNAKNAVEKCYIRPVIREESESFINATGLRHMLIEEIQTNIQYITNDIEIGTKDKKGMLLYGVNSVGKSSLMKSIGINLILAQAGLYVASKTFEYSPYTHIFSRIPSGDNILKGQSTFVTEINELRTILKRSNSSSLVIGDELCCGSEQISAISLVSSGINYLSKIGTSFIFATHIHELCDLDCIKKLKNIHVKHLSVHFDKEKNCLVFDRVLKDGNGDTMYGLEIAKSLDLPPEFVLFAEKVRKEYTGTQQSIVKPKLSTYNSLVFMDICSICGLDTEEIHHITEQQYANSKGIFEDKQFHKNIEHNLINVCEKCHDKIHANEIKVEGYKQTTNGIHLEIENIKDKHKNSNDIENSIKKMRNTGMSLTKILENINKDNENPKLTMYKLKKILSNF
jgi:DNA mismatch repair protein MutS